MTKFITHDEYIYHRVAGNRPRYSVYGYKLHISASNSKLGKIWNFSKIAGNGIQLDGNGTPICNVSGTCRFNCDGCYACASQALCRENVIRNWAENTNLARMPLSFEDSLVDWFKKNPANRSSEKKPRLFRINQSGELETIEELRIWANIAAGIGEQSGYCFALYTKRFDLVSQFMEERNYEPPFNLQINLSECCDVSAPDALKAVFPCFVWDTGQASAAEMVHCPAVLKPLEGHKKGKRNKSVTCEQCRRCYESGRSTAVYNH